jgi:putative Mg2+ transporter-C (MgtC) family protein
LIHLSDWLDLGLRLLLAISAGGAIGWNRQKRGKAAGLRTHMLVSLGAALFILVPLQMGNSFSSDAVGRTIQGVATGVGFLGAGEIVQRSRHHSDRPAITGLTSAAAIWVTAALGIASAFGFWHLVLLGTLLSLLILSGARWLERFIPVQADDEEE